MMRTIDTFDEKLNTVLADCIERGVSMSGQSWWDYFNFRNGGQ